MRREPLEVWGTDFPSEVRGKGIPDGIYDVGHNNGYVGVGLSPETAAFVIAALRRGWLEVGRVRYNVCDPWLMPADSSGANASDSWLWKVGLQTLADEFQLTITVPTIRPAPPNGISSSIACSAPLARTGLGNHWSVMRPCSSLFVRARRRRAFMVWQVWIEESTRRNAKFHPMRRQISTWTRTSSSPDGTTR